MRRCAAAALAGLIFGVGLAISQMTDPNKVLAFLDVFGAWDPSLMFVMGSGLVVAFAGFRLILRRPQPVLDTTFSVPKNTKIDTSLTLGSVAFGVGWGLAGFCPGPAIAALTTGTTEPLMFCVAMFAGFVLHDGTLGRRRRA